MAPSQAVPVRETMPLQGYGAIIIGLIAVSMAAIFIRFAQNGGVPSLVIAGGRLAIAALVLTPVALARHTGQLRRLRRIDLLLALVSGTFLAVHFAAWIASLEFTSVLISVVLVSSSPLWVALLELVFLRARPNRLVLVGLFVAIGGGVMIGVGGGDSRLSPGSDPLLGGLLALLGAVAVAVYFVIGRKLRAQLDLLPYIWLVYTCAAVVLLATIAVTGQPVAGYSPDAYLWVVALALVPQLIGHSSLNYALKYLSATYVAIITQTEPVASAVAAFIIFNERPLPLQIVGSIGIIAGVMVASVGQNDAADAAVDPVSDG